MSEAAPPPRPAIPHRTGDEPIHREGHALPARLIDFWRWAYSDLLNNTTRGVFAEFIVAEALGLELDVRDPWAECDLTLPSGARIEVRSAAYIQSWSQRGPSKIVFSVRPSRRWDPDKGAYVGGCQRNADVFVFALLDAPDRDRIDPLDVAQWRFFVLPTRTINSDADGAKSLSPKRLSRLGAQPCDFRSLRGAVERAHGSTP